MDWQCLSHPSDAPGSLTTTGTVCRLRATASVPEAWGGRGAGAAGGADLRRMAALEGLPGEGAPEGPTMMGRLARELMLSGQGAAGLAQFKVPPFETSSIMRSTANHPNDFQAISRSA